MSLGELKEDKMDEQIAYEDYIEQQEKSTNPISRIQSKYIIWLAILFILGNAFITFGLGGNKNNYYLGFNGFMVLMFIILSQTGDAKPTPRNLREAIEIAEGEGKKLIESGQLHKADFKPAYLISTGKAIKFPKDAPLVWRIGMALFDKDSKRPFYHVFEVDYYKGPVGISAIIEIDKPYDGQEPEVRYVPIASEKLQSFRKSEMFESGRQP